MNYEDLFDEKKLRQLQQEKQEAMILRGGMINMDNGYRLLSVTNPTDTNLVTLSEVFVILEHKDGHTISGWISAKKHWVGTVKGNDAQGG